jgi:hypothetical protein
MWKGGRGQKFVNLLSVPHAYVSRLRTMYSESRFFSSSS